MTAKQTPKLPSNRRIGAPILLVMTALLLLLLLAVMSEELPFKINETLAAAAVTLNAAGLLSAWGVRRHVAGKLAIVLGALVMTGVGWQFFRH